MSDNNTRISGFSQESFAQLSVKQLFVVILIGGLISITTGVVFSSVILSVVIPFSLVFIYAASTIRAKHTDLSKAKIGDSCYFLGFSFTLISLSVALINLGQQEADINIRGIVGGFGAALATTLAGLLCRLWFTTLASSFLSSKDKLEEEIESAMRSFSMQLQSLVDEVNMSITTIGATIGDTNIELNKSYKGQMQENIKSISDSVASFSQRLDEVEVSKDMVVKPINDAMATMIKGLEEHGQNMTLVHANVVEGTSGLSKQIDLSNNLVNDYIEKFGGEFQRISDQQISAFEKATVEISESVRQNFTDISEIKVSLTDNIVNELNVLKNQLDSITNLTEANNVALEKSSEINEKASQILLMSAERLPSLIADLENISTPISRSSEEIADIVQSLVSFNDNISESQQSLTNFSIATSGATKNLKATAKAIDNSSNQLAEDIESIYLSLGKQLKELRGSVD
jgi:hypothetical protein